MDITGKGAVVTGAGSGIGRGIALALAKAGASGVIVADVQSERAEAVAAEVRALGAKSAAFRCDVIAGLARAIRVFECQPENRAYPGLMPPRDGREDGQDWQTVKSGPSFGGQFRRSALRVLPKALSRCRGGEIRT